MNESIIDIIIRIAVIIFFFDLGAQNLTYEQFQSNQIIQADKKNSSWAQEQDYVVMISLDGYRYDYAEKYNALNVLKIQENGASTKRLIPSFPTKTFPNHYTIVTGLRPGNHGIISNSFYSREKAKWYEIRDRTAVQDGSWYGGTPLWVLAEQQEMLSASLFWVGSEAKIQNIYPTYSYAYDGSVPNDYRLTQVVQWLKLPPELRPHMITTYFSLVDDIGHRYGPDHEQTKKAVLEIDSLLGSFLSQLNGLALNVHIVLVSDHGMAAIDHGIVLPDMVNLEDAKVSYSFPPMIYEPDSVHLEQLYNELLSEPTIDVYKSSQIPDYLMLRNEDRVGDLILLTAPPTVIIDKARRVYGGTHGFDPYSHVEMGGIFYAIGPQIKKGVMMPPIESIHIYPFVAKILKLTVPEGIDGDLERLKPILNY